MNFDLRGDIGKKQRTMLEISGIFIFLAIWQLAAMHIGSGSVLPSPIQVLFSYPDLHFNDFLLRNAGFSVGLNLLAYTEAILIAIPLGFVIGLFTPIGASMNRMIEALRYTPLTAVIGLFIAWFGIYFNMKMQFLAFGIFVYLLPVVVQRVRELENVYVQTAETLGASKWQIIRKVFIPGVMSKVSTDIIVLTAISWTYIVFAEVVNNQGGLGSLIFKAGRQSRIDKVFACVFFIILIGVVQDKLFTFIDKKIFKFKYIQEGKK